MSVKIVLDTSKLDALIAKLPGDTKKNVDLSAYRVEGKAKQLAPFELGALKNSGYTNTGKKSNYNAARSAAQAIRPDVKFDSEVKPPNDASAIVGFSIEYALYQELGAPKNNMQAQPYLVPAMESEEKKLTADLKKMIK